MRWMLHFIFYYQDNLDFIRSTGATLIPFSPLEEREVPDADFIYIGGGFPEVFAERLAKNKSMRESIWRRMNKASQSMPSVAD